MAVADRFGHQSRQYPLSASLDGRWMTEVEGMAPPIDEGWAETEAPAVGDWPAMAVVLAVGFVEVLLPGKAGNKGPAGVSMPGVESP